MNALCVYCEIHTTTVLVHHTLNYNLDILTINLGKKRWLMSVVHPKHVPSNGFRCIEYIERRKEVFLRLILEVPNDKLFLHPWLCDLNDTIFANDAKALPPKKTKNEPSRASSTSSTQLKIKHTYSRLLLFRCKWILRYMNVKERAFIICKFTLVKKKANHSVYLSLFIEFMLDVGVFSSLTPFCVLTISKINNFFQQLKSKKRVISCFLLKLWPHMLNRV